MVDARLTPAEVAWTSYDGDSTLIHLPELSVLDGTPDPAWSLDPDLNGASSAVAISRDGSVWNVFFSDRLRQSLGAVAPIRERVDLRRRRVGYRHLCPWINEDPVADDMLAATAAGRLDIDPAHGLFSMAGDEPPQALPAGPVPGEPPPASVTVSYQDGYSDHIGARPLAREALLDQRLDAPTRLVSGSGQLRSNAPREWHSRPRFRTLGDALTAIADDPAPAPTEVIEFQDSATYANETIEWPANATRLIVQAAERERPVIQVQNWTVAAAARYEALMLRGLFIGGEGIEDLTLPPAALIRVEFCTVSHPENELQFSLQGEDIDRVRVVRSLTAGLRLDSPGRVEVADSVVDADAGADAEVLPAMTAPMRAGFNSTASPSSGLLLHLSSTPLKRSFAIMSSSRIVFEAACATVGLRRTRSCPGCIGWWWIRRCGLFPLPTGMTPRTSVWRLTPTVRCCAAPKMVARWGRSTTCGSHSVTRAIDAGWMNRRQPG